MSDIIGVDSYPLTKSAQTSWAQKIMQPLLEGEVSPIEFITKVKGLSSALDEVSKNKEVKNIIIREVEKEGKCVSWSGANVSIKETGVKYDYSNCNDPIYAALIKQKDELDTKIKERESFLKSVPSGTTVVDDETGECYTLHPAIRTASESFVVSFGK